MSAPEDRVGSKYGAPMGRGQSVPLLGKVRFRRVRFVDGDYDKGGAYWGGGTPLFYAHGAEGTYTYVRAADRDGAREALQEFLDYDARIIR